MSYARFIEADVYVFLATSGHLECCACSLGPESYRAVSTSDMIDHLNQHLSMGDNVPKTCFERLLMDEQENDEWIRNYHSEKAHSETVDTDTDTP